MNKLKSDEAYERTISFLEQLSIDKFKITDEHEFNVLATYYINTDFYQSNKDLVDLSDYDDIEDVYNEIMIKVTRTPFLVRFILAGLFPVMYYKWIGVIEHAEEN